MIDLETIYSTAKLARLKIQDDEAKGLAENFERILNYFNDIEGINVDGIEPLYSPFELEGKLRKDEIVTQVLPSEILATAPELRDKEYLVPPVVG